MKRKKRSFFLLVLTLLSLGSFIYTVVNFPPDSQFSFLGSQFPISTTPLFLLLAFLSTFFLFSLLFRSYSHGTAFGLFITSYCILRLFDLTHPLFLFLLLALLGVFLLSTRKK